MQQDNIAEFLRETPKLSAYCSQNGWIDDDSIRYEIIGCEESEVLIYVTFLESIMEGGGCQADIKSCYGRLRLKLDANGKVMSAQTL